MFSLWFPIGMRVTWNPRCCLRETYFFCKEEVLIGLIAVRVMKRPVMSTQFFTVSSRVASDDLPLAMKWQRVFMPLSRILPSYYTAVPIKLNTRRVHCVLEKNVSHTLAESTYIESYILVNSLFTLRFVHWPPPIYTTVQKFGVSKIFLMFLK